MSKINAHTYTFTSFYDAGVHNLWKNHGVFHGFLTLILVYGTDKKFIYDTDFIDTYGHNIIADRHVRLRLSKRRKILYITTQ